MTTFHDLLTSLVALRDLCTPGLVALPFLTVAVVWLCLAAFALLVYLRAR